MAEALRTARGLLANYHLTRAGIGGPEPPDAESTTQEPTGRGGWEPSRSYTLREAYLEAAVLLAHVLGIERASLLGHPERTLGPAERDEFEALLVRRVAGEPVAYLTGHREFFGLDILVNRDVLVPRPETELVVEEAMAAAASQSGATVSIADVGTGSGAIAVAVARHLPAARVYASDVSVAALAVAAVNCRRLGVADRVTLLHGDLLSPLPEAVSIIVANLPYISAEEWSGLAPEVARYEPALALLAEERGMALYLRLLAQAPHYLLAGGSLIAEIAPGQEGTLAEAAGRHFSGAEVGIRKDYGGLERVLIVRTTA